MTAKMTIFRLSIPSHSSLDCLQSAFSLKIRHVRWLRQRAWSTVSLAVTLQRKVRDSLRTAEKSSLRKIAFLRRGKRRPEMHLLFARREAARSLFRDLTQQHHRLPKIDVLSKFSREH